MNNLTPDIIYQWPLILIMEDCFCPENAAALLSAFQGIDDESCQLTIKLRAMEAQANLTNN